MFSHIIPPRRILFILLSVLTLAAGCAAGRAPVKIIGVSDAQARDATPMLLFFLEVRNPTKRRIVLSQLDYELSANPWFTTHGQVQFARTVTPGGSAVIQVPVRLDRLTRRDDVDSGVPYTFAGNLRVLSGSRDRDWPVRIKGELGRDTSRSRSAYVAPPAVAAR